MVSPGLGRPSNPHLQLGAPLRRRVGQRSWVCLVTPGRRPPNEESAQVTFSPQGSLPRIERILGTHRPPGPASRAPHKALGLGIPPPSGRLSSGQCVCTVTLSLPTKQLPQCVLALNTRPPFGDSDVRCRDRSHRLAPPRPVPGAAAPPPPSHWACLQWGTRRQPGISLSDRLGCLPPHLHPVPQGRGSPQVVSYFSVSRSLKTPPAVACSGVNAVLPGGGPLPFSDSGSGGWGLWSFSGFSFTCDLVPVPPVSSPRSS